ncbi:hypothetical protein N665_1812s0002 [Sinapis alba]|nr:hypothetical protein N665_1812s0002 [Sinapis alba]
MSTAIQALAGQRPPQAPPANVAEVDDHEEEEDAVEQLAAHDSPFAPLRNNRHVIQNQALRAADDYHWENNFKSEIPEFYGNSTAEELLDWIVTVEEILEFKRVPFDRCVPVIAMKFRNRAAAWWSQLKTTRNRLGKPKIMAWEKLKSKLKKMFLPYNYDQTMFQRLHHIRQGPRSVAEYSTEFFLLLTRVDIQDSERQLVAHFSAGLCQQIQHTINLFNPLSLSKAHQQALTIESQTKSTFSWTTSRQTRPVSQQHSSTTTDDTPPQQPDSPIVPFIDKTTSRPSSLRCFSCGEIGHRQSNCPKRNRRGLLLDTTGNDVEVIYDDDNTDDTEDTVDLVADNGLCLMIKRVCLAPRHIEDNPQHHNLFHSKCTIEGKVCKFIIDSGSSENVIAEDVVNKLKLSTELHPYPYKLACLSLSLWEEHSKIKFTVMWHQ